MFSDTVFLHADSLIAEARLLDYKEELTGGKKVNQKNLAETALFAAFAYLSSQGYIGLSVREGKILFIKTKTAIATRLKEKLTGVTGLENVIFGRIGEERGVGDAVSAIFSRDVQNPWGDILDIIKDDLVNRGIMEKIVKGKVLFITTHKHVIKGTVGTEEKKHLKDLEAATEKIKIQGDLYKHMMAAISRALAGRQKQRDHD